MGAVIIIASFATTLAAAYFTTGGLRPRARAAVFVLYILLCAYFFPVLLWLPVYFSADFSKKVKFPAGFKEKIYSARDNERKRLPVNRDGLIADADYKPGDTGVKRIIILGDSFAAGYGLEYKDTLGARLQAVLGGGQVINGAFFGTNAQMQVEYFFTRLAKYNPDIILIYNRMDDVMPLDEKYYLEKSADAIRKYAPHWTLGMKNFVFKYESYLIRGKFWAVYRADPRKAVRENTLNYYARLNKYTSAGGVRVLLLDDKCPLRYRDVCGGVEAAAAEYKWELLKPADKIDFTAPGMTIAGDGHPSARANRLLAEFIGGYIKENPR